MNIDIHADDFGYSLNTSKDIIECVKSGNLNSFSIICNTSHFEECMEYLYSEIPTLAYLPLISVHINLPEGFSTSEYLPMSWGKLFINSYLNKNKLKEEIKKEIKYQIDRTWEAIRKCIDIAKQHNIEVRQKSLRLDSHVHTHLIPVVWESLIEVIEENNYDVEFIRNPKEPLKPFIANSLLSYGIVNILKNRILMAYSGKVDNYCERHGLKKMYMWGLTMSGHMDFARIKKVYPKMVEYCEERNRDLEILFHPGLASKDEYSKEMNIDYFNDFNSSKNRSIEKDSVLRIKEVI